MSIRKSIERGLQHLERRAAVDRLGTAQTFTWKGKEIPCVPSSLLRGTVIIVGGNEEIIDLTLFVRRIHFITFDSTLITMDNDLLTMDNDTPVPVAGRKLTFRGKQYRILTAKESGPESHFELNLADPNSNK